MCRTRVDGLMSRTTYPNNTMKQNLRTHAGFAAAMLLCLAPITFAQTAPQPTTPPTSPAAPASGAASSQATPSGEVIELSPFQVDASKTSGYYTENTLAGSRLNTRIADLGASITVVTKQQLIDTASIDMNDVFLYEANTEGAANYTDFNVDTRGAMQDRNAGFQGGAPSLPFGPATSNRVRGIAAVDRLRDYYPSNQRLPFDVYNTDSVDINRGPNSLLFGLGSAAGIVNQSQTRANLRERDFRVDLRYGSNESFRGSFNVNVPLWRDKLAFHFAALHDERGFERKPSYDITQRQYGTFTFKPFPKTTIRGSLENYENRNRRPNSTSPRDFVSPWIAAGRPAYNPVSRMLTVNGVTTGPYDLSNGNSILALYAASGNTIQEFGNSRPVVAVEGSTGQEINFMQQHISGTPNTAGVQAQFNYVGQPVRATRSLGPITRHNILIGAAAGITFAQPSVNQKSIYDWDSINILSGNHGDEEALIYNAELEHEILPNLHLQVGWYREDFKQRQHYYISQQTGVTLYVDTDSVRLDNTPNPNFGRPYIEITQPDTFEHPEDNMTGRASLAYELDLSKRDDLFKWVGRHRFMGLLQHNQVKRDQLRYRPYYSGNNQLWNPVNTAGTPAAPDMWTTNVTQNTIERRFYVGDTTGRVNTGPGLFVNGSRSHTLRWFNQVTQAWVNEPVQEELGLHFVSQRTKQEVKSRAFALQSYLLDDRFVGTFGVRQDRVDSRTGGFGGAASTALTRFPDGFTNPANLNNFSGVLVVPRDWTKSYGGVARPFKGWTAIENGARSGSVVMDTVRSLSVHYNRSETFTPAGRQTDFYNVDLALPTGKGKDYGFGFSMFNDKLVARVNWYEASQVNSRGAALGQALSRTQTVDDLMFRSWAQIVTGSTDNRSAAVYNILKLPAYHAAQPFNVFFNVPVGATQTVDSKGKEFQLVYNPTSNWNIKFTAGQQKTIITKFAPEYDAWVKERQALWTTATATGFTSFWNFTGQDFINGGITNSGVGTTQRVQDWFFTNVDAIARTGKRNEGKNNPGQREWRWNVISNYQFQTGRLNGLSVGGAFRWEDEAVIGFRGSAPDADGIIRSLDVNRPVFDKSREHYDFWASYTFRSLPWIGDKVRTKVQLNVRDAFETGGLEPISVNPDGSPAGLRIVEPRQWFLSATFDF